MIFVFKMIMLAAVRNYRGAGVEARIPRKRLGIQVKDDGGLDRVETVNIERSGCCQDMFLRLDGTC